MSEVDLLGATLAIDVDLIVVSRLDVVEFPVNVLDSQRPYVLK